MGTLDSPSGRCNEQKGIWCCLETEFLQFNYACPVSKEQTGRKICTGIRAYEKAYLAKLMPSVGSGISAGTCSAGRLTCQVPSGYPYRHRFSAWGSHCSYKLSRSEVRALSNPLLRLMKSVTISSDVCGWRPPLRPTNRPDI